MATDRKITGLTETQVLKLPRINAKEIDAYNSKILKEASYVGMGASAEIRDNIKENNGLRYIKLVNGQFATFKISEKDAAGDGTVPWQSGRAPLKQSGVKQVFQMKGFDHQGSYKNTQVKRSVLYSIVRIIKENNIQPKNR